MDRRIKIFVSYAHSSKEHMAWVKNLAELLRDESFDVTLDQDDLRLGELIEKFQREGISQADRVLVVCSETYVAKCDTDRKSGAGMEKAVMELVLWNNPGTIKFIPLIRDNPTKKMPSCLTGRLWLDANDDEKLADAVKALVKELRG